MKTKLFMLVLALVLSVGMVLSLAACNTTDAPEKEAETPATNENNGGNEDDVNPDFVEDTEAGLYAAGSNFTVQVKTWAELVEGGHITVDGAEVVTSDGTLEGELLVSRNVTRIDNGAFGFNPKLVAVKIPGTVTEIRNSAFYKCDELVSVELCEGVRVIEEEAFGWCQKLESITLPASLESITGAFNGSTALVSIEVAEGNKTFKSVDGDLYSIDGKVLYQYAIGKAETDVTIPDGVVTIADYAFRSAANITTVTLPDSVESIGYYSFNYTLALKNINFGNGLVEIGEFAFAECGASEITLPDSVEKIGGYAFCCCGNLVKITLSKNLLQLGEAVFVESRNLESIEIDPESAVFKSMDGDLYSADLLTLVQYALGKNATVIEIPYYVTSIGDYAFASCNNFVKVVLHENVESVGDFAFLNCDGLNEIIIPEGVKSLGEGALGDNDSLVVFTLPSTIEYLGENVFMWNTALRYVFYNGDFEMWEAIEKGSEWFDGTYVLYEVHCNDGTVIYTEPPVEY